MNRLQIGDRIGDYRVVSFIGAGGMGEVYQAVHEKLGRLVAVKVLGKISDANPNYRTRFFNEARLQASLHHPNIATLYDFQETSRELFIFMEFVDGECLSDLVAARSLAVEDALRVFEKICEAIVYVHAHGIVHRDIKAENIKLSLTGEPKLLDFGIAKDAFSDDLTRVGGVIGTPHYVAPEQLEGAPASPQTDIWALGVLLYKMLTGNLPFDTESFETLRLQIARARFAPPAELNSAVSPKVSRVVEQCLCKVPARRYPTAEELLQEIRAIRRSDYSPNGNFAATVAKQTPVARITFAAAAAAAGAVILLLSAIGMWFWLSNAAEAECCAKPPAVVLTKNNLQETSNKAANTSAMILPSTKNNNSRVETDQTDAEQLRILVDTIDGKAKVVRNQQEIGATPLELEAADGERINLTLRREGFQDREVQFEASTGKKVYTFSLQSK